MSTSFTWYALLVDAQNRPVPGVEVDVQLFNCSIKRWVVASSAKSSAVGLLHGKGVIEDDSPLLAPAMRLVQSGQASVFLAVPRFALATAPEGLNVDFGELTLLPEALRFSAPPATVPSMVDEAPFMIGGLVGRSTAAAQPAGLGVGPGTLRERGGVLLDSSDAARDPAREATSRAPVTISAFASTVGKEIGGAQSALKAKGFSLGQVSLKARTVVGADARVDFPDLEQLKTIPAGALSDLDIQFHPEPQPANETALLVPDVRQLTEGLARRVLASVGLTLDASYGPAHIAPGSAIGQAMLQTPAAGAAVARGARILVVFAGNDS